MNFQKGQGAPIILFVIVLLLVIGSIYYFTSRDTEESDDDSSPSPSAEVSPSQSPQATISSVPEPDKTKNDDGAMMDDGDKGELKTFEIVGRNFEFSTTEIRVKKGDRVKILFGSIDGFHDWTVDEFNVATDRIQTGETAEVEFIANEVGTFEFYCSVGSHRQLGMIGSLIVEE